MYYDVIVVGGGHAGSEAANAAARLGARTLLVTSFLARLGQLSCNPAVGGIAKGTVAREVDAVGGLMGKAADRTTLHFRMLNRSKGPAVWAPRAQCDRGLYARAIRSLLEERRGVEMYQGTVTGLLVESGAVRGVRCGDGSKFLGRTVVLTTGTFLRGMIRVGVDRSMRAGRAGDAPSVVLAEQLREIGLRPGRFKTGTPPRVDGRTVEYAAFTRQESEPEEAGRFSHWERAAGLARGCCWIGTAGPAVLEIVARHLKSSAMYGGAIGATGPRYCPSIEDKVVKFPDADSHQIFLEPEGVDTHELYVNGLSTSLPPDVQREFLRRVPGLENARMTQPGYAIEYDYFPPCDLDRTLCSKTIEGLYLAGQINGTTGYEEAAGQGVVAGFNAGLAARSGDPWVPGREEAYLGVLVDDLVTRGVDEPYRLFTSRAEFRLALRQDNCLARLGPTAERLGALTDGERRTLHERLDAVAYAREWVAAAKARPEAVNVYLDGVKGPRIGESQPLERLLKRPEVRLVELVGEDRPLGDPGIDPDSLAAVEMEVKYRGYLRQEQERAELLRSRESVQLPADLPYGELGSLSMEARQKLASVRPDSLAQAGRIPGVSPADLQNLLVELKRREVARRER